MCKIAWYVEGVEKLSASQCWSMAGINEVRETSKGHVVQGFVRGGWIRILNQCVKTFIIHLNNWRIWFFSQRVIGWIKTGGLANAKCSLRQLFPPWEHNLIWLWEDRFLYSNFQVTFHLAVYGKSEKEANPRYFRLERRQHACITSCSPMKIVEGMFY